MSVFNSLTVLDEFEGVTTTKGDLIVNNGTTNIRLPIGLNDYVLTADSNEPSGIKWSVGGGGGGSTNVIEYFQFNLTNTPLSTNNTSPVIIDEFQNTPTAGNYVILCSLVTSISNININGEIGFYKNNVLLTGSNKIINPALPRKLNNFYLQVVTNFGGSDVFDVKFNSQTTNSTISISEGNLLLIKFTNSEQFLSNIEYSTNATIPVILDITTTPDSGFYLVLFSTTFSLTKNNETITIGLYKDNTLINNGERTLGGAPNTRLEYQFSTITDFTGTQLLNIKVNSSNKNNDIILYTKNLIIIPIS